MGSCVPSEENEARIKELEQLLKDQEMEKANLKLKLDEEQQRQKRYKARRRGEDPEASAEKIEQLTNEKKQVFKTMLKERKNVSKLEDQIQEYKTQLSDMESQVHQLREEKRKAQKRAEAAQQRQELSNNRPSSTKSNKSNNDPFQSVLHGINIPKVNLPGFSGNNIKSEPVKKKEENNKNLKPSYTDRGRTKYDSDDNATSNSEYVSTSEMEDSETDDRGEIKSDMTTEILDQDYDAQTEATHVYSWLHGQKISSKDKQLVKQLKQRLASLLTSRSEGYRQTLIQAYKDKYGRNMEKDIKNIITKGHAMEIIHGLLMTRAEYDAILISECVQNWDIEPVADIICCRSMKQLQELHAAYKKKCKLDVKKQLQALAQKDKKKTLVKVIGSIFDLDRKESKDVDMNKVNEDLNFILTNKNFKGETKERLVLIFTANSVQFVKVLNGQFKLKSKDSLSVFIDKKLGPKSTAGYFCKTRIQYALDTPDFYAKKIKKLGQQYNKNKKELADIFIQRMEIDLDLIQRTWAMKKYGDGKDLKAWISMKTRQSKAGYFLQKMLDNCVRYSKFRDGNASTRKSKLEEMMMDHVN